MGVVGGGFRNLRLKSLAAACSLSRPSFIVFLLAILSTERGVAGGVLRFDGGLRVVLLAGESLVLLAAGGMLSLHFYVLLLPFSISRSADGAEMRGECSLGFGNGANYPRLSLISCDFRAILGRGECEVTLSSVLPSRSTRPTVVGIYKVA